MSKQGVTEKSKEKEITVEPTDTFTERFAAGAVVAHTPDGFFIIDFLRPVVSLVRDDSR